MKGLIIYRLLTILMNIFCFFLGLSLLLGLMMVFANPGFAFGFFLMLCVVLYAWYANKFLNTVIIKEQPFTKRQKDWLQVNAIVTLIFSVLLMTQSITFIRNPNIVKEAFQQMPVQSPTSMIVNFSAVLLFFSMVLLIHVSWTLIMVRQNKDMIEP